MIPCTATWNKTPPARFVRIFQNSTAPLEAAAVALGQPAFRGRQIFQWIHQRDVCDFQAMTDVPGDVRARLAADAVITEPALETKQVSADGTTKFLLRLADGRHIEAVYIPE